MTRAIVVFAGIAAAATLCVDHMDSIPALLVIAPGYVVQAWLFERHHALGGLGYRLTMIAVSALFWTVLLLGIAVGCKHLVARFANRQES
ncbi:MAG TPA: hypothetical protein VNH14_08840 [Gemmatimonadales bacterium]|nr:hypothetical protein [Gemmatimonadales bacterium]